MDEIERTINGLPWRKPSPALKEKILNSEPEHSQPPERHNRAVSLRWAIVSATAAGIVGFVLGANRTPTVESAVAVRQNDTIQTDIRVVETFSSLNSFDFTAGAMQVLPGEYVGSIDGEMGIEK